MKYINKTLNTTNPNRSLINKNNEIIDSTIDNLNHNNKRRKNICTKNLNKYTTNKEMNIKIDIKKDSDIYKKFDDSKFENVHVTLANNKKPLSFKSYTDKLKNENRVRSYKLN